MRKNLWLAMVLSARYFPALTQTSSQTRTATFLNNLNNFRDVFGDQNYDRASAEDLAAEDGIHGCSSRLRGVKDSPFNAILPMVEPSGIMIKSNFIVFTNM